MTKDVNLFLRYNNKRKLTFHRKFIVTMATSNITLLDTLTYHISIFIFYMLYVLLRILCMIDNNIKYQAKSLQNILVFTFCNNASVGVNKYDINNQ